MQGSARDARAEAEAVSQNSRFRICERDSYQYSNVLLEAEAEAAQKYTASASPDDLVVGIKSISELAQTSMICWLYNHISIILLKSPSLRD